MSRKLAQNQPINLRKNPARGILSEIAREHGVHPHTVQMGVKRRSPKWCRIFLQKYNEAIRIQKEIADVLG